MFLKHIVNLLQPLQPNILHILPNNIIYRTQSHHPHETLISLPKTQEDLSIILHACVKFFQLALMEILVFVGLDRLRRGREVIEVKSVGEDLLS